MGATTFHTIARGPTAKRAFESARNQAQYDYGHSGYTGTIAEKDSFTMIPVPPGKDVSDFINELFSNCDPRIDGKWGPAGCIYLGDEEFVFFGWASC